MTKKNPTLDYPVHPTAAVWPMLPAYELEALADSIRDVGLLEPLVLTPDGQLLDGRNRLAACRIAGVEPTTVVYEGDPVEFVLARNDSRRHMTTGARAMARAVTLASAGKRKDGRWERNSLHNGNSADMDTRRRLTDAGTVLDWAPDLAPGVIAGSPTLKEALDEAKQRQWRAQSDEARLERLGQSSPELAAAVREEQLTLAGAEAELAERKRKADEDARQREAARIQMNGHVGSVLLILAGWPANPGAAEAFADGFHDSPLDITVDHLGSAIDGLTELLDHWKDRSR